MRHPCLHNEWTNAVHVYEEGQVQQSSVSPFEQARENEKLIIVQAGMGCADGRFTYISRR
jgi:hypothetical protein